MTGRPIPYDDANPESILRHAQRLIGKTWREIEPLTLLPVRKVGGKEGMGDLIESYLGIPKNNDAEPDFPACGIEVKTAPLKPDGKPRYPLSICMIDYPSILSETWETAKVKKKIAHLLLIFYEEGATLEAHRVKHVFLWQPSADDWRLFEADWRKIRETLASARPDGLHESDTWFLAARRKGGKDETRILENAHGRFEVPSRCFAFRRPYLEMLLGSGILTEETKTFSLLAGSPTADHEASIRRIIDATRPFWGKTVREIAGGLPLALDTGGKSYAANVLARAFGFVREGRWARELVGGGLNFKTIRCNPGMKPIYAMSLRNFDYVKVGAVAWDDSTLKEDVERMLLAVIELPRKGASQEDAVLKAVIYHEPSEADLLQMRTDWDAIKGIVATRPRSLTGRTGKLIQARPKAQNARDTGTAADGSELVKKGFFLRTAYLTAIIKEHGLR